jgi:DNA-binding beta-propeller fold protein YncE
MLHAYNQEVPVISRRIAVLSGLAAAAACRRKRGDGFEGYAFVANEAGNAVAVVHLTAFAVVKHIRLPDAPSAVLDGGSRPYVYALTPASGTLHEIDAATLKVSRTLRVAGSAVSARLEPGGKAMWILGEGALYRIDPAEMRTTAAIRLPEAGTDLDLAEWTGLAAVAHPASRTVSVASLTDGAVVRRIEARGEPGPVRFRSDGKVLMVPSRSDRLLTFIDLKSGRTMVHLPLAVRPDHICTHPDGGQVFITGEGRDAVVVIYPYYVPEVAETVLAGSRPGPMTCSDTHLFVSNPAAGDVTILDVERRRVMAVASVGADPGSITLTPDGEYALVLNRQSGDMAVLRITGLRPDRRKTAALFTLIPVGSRPVGAVVRAV